MVTIHEIPVTPFQQNCTVWVCDRTGESVVCDCGDAGPVLDFLERRGLTPRLVVATHGHLDHIGGTAALQRALGIPFAFPPGDDPLRLGLPEQARWLGLPGAVEAPEAEVALREGDRIRFGESELRVYETPGHTPGHVVFHDAEGARLVAGDVLFRGSVGRTDLPGGSFEQLRRSIVEKLYVLPPETVVHCGHGPTTTIGHEAATNPFVRLG